MRNKAPQRWTVLAIAALSGLALRLALFEHQTLDYTKFLEPWYEFIVQNGRISSFQYDFYNYTPPYLYLLSLSTLLNLQPLFAIKVVSLGFEIVLMVVAYHLIRRLRPQAPVAAYWALGVLWFLPTIVLNGSFWGQCDVIHTSLIALSLLFVAGGRSFWACLAYGVALSIKLQSIFLLPLFAMLVWTRQVSFVHLIAIPTMYLLLILPCVAMGRSVGSLLTIYFRQAGEYGSLTLNAPNVYQWLPDHSWPWLPGAGIVLAGACSALLVLCFIFARCRRVPMQPSQVLNLAALFCVLQPFLLPRMHERYFFVADVLAVIYAFSRRDRWFLPVWIGGASLLSYFPFLFGLEPIKLSVGSCLMAAALGVLLLDYCKDLVSSGTPATGSVIFSSEQGAELPDLSTAARGISLYANNASSPAKP